MSIRKLVDRIAVRGYEQSVTDCEARQEEPSIEAGRAGAYRAVLDAFASGELATDRLQEETAHAASARAHERVTDHAKHMLQKFQLGQLPLAELLDEVIVPIGDGQTVRHLRTVDALGLQEMFKAVDRAAREAAAARDLFVDKIYQPWFSVLVQYGVTVGEAHDQGLI